MIGKCNEHFGCRREAAASDEQQLRTPEDGRIAQLTTETLVTRINSLLYIEENLPAMEKIVQDRSACIFCSLHSLHACYLLGNVPLHGMSGDVPLHGMSGDVPLHGMSGDVPLHGMSGDVPLHGMRGSSA